jgi:hypothetical protein
MRRASFFLIGILASGAFVQQGLRMRIQQLQQIAAPLAAAN